MPVERTTRKITIDYSGPGKFGIKEFEGYIEHHCHEIDGSETILIRTDPRESVQNFLRDEIVKV